MRRITRFLSKSSWAWSNPSNEVHNVRENSVWIVGNGEKIRIWEDRWCLGKQPLMSQERNEPTWNGTVLQLCFDEETVKD